MHPQTIFLNVLFSMIRFFLLFSSTLLLTFSSCKKKETPIRTYTVTLDLRPSINDANGTPSYTDPAKNIYLSLSAGSTYNLTNASGNAGIIDLVVYDGSTTSTAIGDVHFISPGGGTLSLKQLPTAYVYLEPGSTNTGVSYFDLVQMSTWSVYNTTKIRDESGLNGFTVADFEALDNQEEYSAAVSRVRTPGTDNSNQAKKMLNVAQNSLMSKIWFFEYRNGLTAFAKITDYRYLPDGYVTLEVKMPQ